MKLAKWICALSLICFYGCCADTHESSVASTTGVAVEPDLAGCVSHMGPAYCILPLLSEYDPAKHIGYSAPVQFLSNQYGSGVVPISTPVKLHIKSSVGSNMDEVYLLTGHMQGHPMEGLGGESEVHILVYIPRVVEYIRADIRWGEDSERQLQSFEWSLHEKGSAKTVDLPSAQLLIQAFPDENNAGEWLIEVETRPLNVATHHSGNL